MLKALYSERPGFKPAVVSGTSIGAITAAVLVGAKGDPIDALQRLWLDKLSVPPARSGLAALTAWLPHQVQSSLAILGNPGMYEPRLEFLLAPWAATSIYDTWPLRETLGELVDPGKLNAGETRVILGAIDVATAESKYFDTAEGPLTFEHVAASGSLPPSFPMTEVDGHQYWDGGLFTNLPLSPAINGLEQCDGGDVDTFRELIVVELFPMVAPIPTDMAGVQERMTQIHYSSRLDLDSSFFDKIGRIVDLAHTADRELPADSPVKKDPMYQELLAHRKIDRFYKVTATFAPELGNAADFSPPTIEARIQAGYDDAVKQGIGTPGPIAAEAQHPAAPARSKVAPKPTPASTK